VGPTPQPATAQPAADAAQSLAQRRAAARATAAAANSAPGSTPGPTPNPAQTPQAPAAVQPSTAAPAQDQRWLDLYRNYEQRRSTGGK
jgi:hypothetical protein